MSTKSSSSSSTAGRKEIPKSRKCSRKTRARARKPKYLSLKLELFPSQQQQHKQQKKKSKSKTLQKPTMQETSDQQQQQQQQQQLNLFPLHPENMVLDLNDDHQQVAFLLETATDSSTSLQSLLGISSNTASTTTTAATADTSDDDPLSLFRRQQDQSEEAECGGGPSLLVRTAMRCKERDASEERWVSYCEVVKKEPEEVSSDRNHTNPASAPADYEEQGMKMGLVGLKLDYEEIMNAWSDKKSLFVEGESPQTVPDLQDMVSMDNGLGSMMRVPEMVDGMKMEKGQREASVLRYKEKRQSRLFSKRIRYEVRKVNAEKRPRLKGRFVKRSGEE